MSSGPRRIEKRKEGTMLARGVFSSILLISCVTLGRAQFRCPEPKGFFPDPEQCDLYFACVDGKAEEKLCKDGLVFRDDNPKKELCDIPANVPCGDRTLLRKLSSVLFSNFSNFSNYPSYNFEAKEDTTSVITRGGEEEEEEEGELSDSLETYSRPMVKVTREYSGHIVLRLLFREIPNTET